MFFGPLPVHSALGAILVHSQKLEGRALKKGRVLSAQDIEALAGAGIETVIVARLGPADFDPGRA